MQDLNRHVALSEEFVRNPSAKAKSGHLFDRRVVRIVTPGTLVDEKFIRPSENNFLLVLHADKADASPQDKMIGDVALPPSQPVGLAWLDLSTGEFFTQATNFASLPSELLRIDARELVVSESVDFRGLQNFLRTIGQENRPVTRHAGHLVPTPMSEWTSRLESPISPEEERRFTKQEIAAGSILLDYVKEKLLGLGMKLQAPIKRYQAQNMGIDRSSMRGLEVLETSQPSGGTKGSLLHSVRRTVTKSGARLLRERVSSPSTNLAVIEQRLDLVELLLGQTDLRDKLVSLLKRTFDSQRLAQKFALSRGDADDLVSLHRTILVTHNIAQVIRNCSESIQGRLSGSLLEQLSRFSLESPLQLASAISEAIDEDALLENHLNAQLEIAGTVSKAQDVLNTEGNDADARALSRIVKSRASSKVSIGPSVQEDHNLAPDSSSLYEDDSEAADPATGITSDEHDSWIMRRTASPILERLHEDLAKLFEEKSSLTAVLKQSSGAASLTLRWTPGLGHFCHVKGLKDVRASVERLRSARSVGSSKSTRSFYISEWSTLGARIDQLKLQIKSEEQRVLHTLRQKVVENLVKIRRNAAVLDEIDVACSFATLASEHHFVRPILNEGRSHRILEGQHPTVMLGLEEQGRHFVSNDCLVGDKELIWLITGPNMAGKSTFLRQNALISILAQVGSFVPAKYAEVGTVDQIFSRIGSADNLYQDQSTFMVEMLETAQILKQATPRSFVIMDEVGRGTTPEDGVAISYACLYHLHNINKCRTLFATHFHTLANMTQDWPSLGRYCTDVSEDSNGSFTYMHRLRGGVNRESHALKVARLAGMPEAALDIASEVKKTLKAGNPGFAPESHAAIA